MECLFETEEGRKGGERGLFLERRRRGNKVCVGDCCFFCGIKTELR